MSVKDQPANSIHYCHCKRRIFISNIKMILRLKRSLPKTLKRILTIVGFIMIKCWANVLLLLTITLIVYLWLGLWPLLILIPAAIVHFLFKLSDVFIYHPDSPPDSRQNVCSPQAVELSFTDLYLTTADQVKIHCIFIQQQQKANEKILTETPITLVYFHGNAGNIGHRLINVHELYHYLKCNILLVEYRGYGYSQGKPSESGLYLDAQAALDYLHKRSDIDKSKIVLYGRSLGAAVAINLAVDARYSHSFACLIIENTFTSIPDIARVLFDNRLMRMLPNWLFGSKYDSLAKIGQVKVPVLFLSGLADELIPPFMMNHLYHSATSSMKALQTFQKGSHNFTWRCDGYYQVISSFLEKVFSPDGTITRREVYISAGKQDEEKDEPTHIRDEPTTVGVYHMLPV